MMAKPKKSFMGVPTMKIRHRLSWLGCLALTVALCGSCTSTTQDRIKNPQNQETTSPSPSTSIPTLSQSCTNEKVGYTVQYPQKWFANSRQELSEPEYVIAACSYFDEQQLQIEPYTENNAAIHIRLSKTPFSKLRQMDDKDKTSSKKLFQNTTEVNDRTAIVTEKQATGKAMLPEGLKFYSYKVNMDDRTLIATTYDRSSRKYQRNKEILDAMMDSLEIKPSMAQK
jgi:hypothetical protein